MYNTTTSLDSTSPGSLNTSGEKAAFYIFHLLPEWLVAAVLLGCNVRERFGTRLWGDYRWRDETPKEKQKREEKESKHAEKAKAKMLDSDV